MVPATTSRVNKAQTDIWSVVNEAVAQSRFDPVVNLGQGFFGYNPPNHVLQALKQNLEREDCNQYAPPKGRERLRKALARANRALFDRDLDWQTEVLVTTGANEGILSIIMAYVEPGDEVIVVEPFFDQFLKNVTMAGGIAKLVSLKPQASAGSSTTASEWKLSSKDLENATSPRTKLLILNTPHNPIGKVFSEEELIEIGNFCRKHSILVLSDEVYGRMAFDTDFPNVHLASKFADLTLTVGSAGKDFAATGWRVGFVLGEKHLLDPVLKAHTAICFAAPNAAREAFAVAYEDTEKDDYWMMNRKAMQTKMDKLNEVWPRLGIPFVKPSGGYFVLVDLACFEIPSDHVFPEALKHAEYEKQLCWFLINEVGVAALPPSGYYTPETIAKDGRLWFRFAVCRNDDVLELAKERLMGLSKFVR